jgi:CubicO group peptidase (beta-lactamase class C family)
MIEDRNKRQMNMFPSWLKKMDDAFAQIGKLLEKEVALRKITGLSATIIHDQDIVWSQHYGHANREQGFLANSKTRYGTASITKCFTATLLMHLRDQGKLRTDDTLEDYISGLKFHGPFADTRQPTIRQIAAHVSGLPAEAPLDYRETFIWPSTEEILESIKGLVLMAPPQTEFRYSNLGYALLGHLIEQVSGKSYEEMVTEVLLEPLGMKSSSFDDAYFWGNREDPSVAFGYAGEDCEVADPYEPPWKSYAGFLAAGGLWATTEDLARFISFQFSDGKVNGKEILNVSTLKEMHAPVFVFPDWSTAIGLGWGMGPKAGYTNVRFEGSAGGFQVRIQFVPSLKIGVALASNRFIGVDKMHPITSSIIEHLAAALSKS